MRVCEKTQQSSLTSLDIADQMTLRPVMTPALPSQRESLQHALRLLAGIAIRMGQPGDPLPPRDLTCSPPEAMNAKPLHDERSS
jgi:hypothetical protein